MMQRARAALVRAKWRELGLFEDDQGKAEPEDDGQSFAERFQVLQAVAWEKINTRGNPWIISDFETIDSPLTHAEFLLAHDDKEDLREMQERRILPTCPPTLEYDGSSKRRHVGFQTGELKKLSSAKDTESPRVPHHAALFAYTCWTNLYSQHNLIIKSDIVSGPLGKQFGLEVQGKTASGIRDVAVLPSHDIDDLPKEGFSTPFLTHTRYWDWCLRCGVGDQRKIPHHIESLRTALQLKNG